MDDTTKCPVCGNAPCTCPQPEATTQDSEVSAEEAPTTEALEVAAEETPAE